MKKIIIAVVAVIVIAAVVLALTLGGKSGITLDKAEHTFTAEGETVQLTADTKADSISWTSSDESVAVVDANGVVHAVAPGTATITATAGEASATCTVKCDWVNPVDLDELYNALYAELYPLDADGYPTGPHAEDLMNPNPEYGMTEEDIAMQIEMYYPGLTAIEANQMHVFIPGMSFSAYEVVLIELANAADMDAVKEILQARIDAQAAGGAWYPEAVEGWTNNARIVTNGNYIMLAVGADCDKFVDAFNAQF